MKRALCLMSGMLLVAAAAVAQPPGAGQKLDLAADLARGYNSVKANLTAAADAMPEADYGFKPGPAPELRTFGRLFAHTAQVHYGYCSAFKGVANPVQGKNLEEELKTKAEFVKALADSFAFCDSVFTSLNDSNQNEFLTQGRGQISRGALAANIVIHDNEMYGTTAVYMRAKGMVPPSTERMQEMRGGRGRGR
jgi:uncharacterized damage-inducible protein DinB